MSIRGGIYMLKLKGVLPWGRPARAHYKLYIIYIIFICLYLFEGVLPWGRPACAH